MPDVYHINVRSGRQVSFRWKLTKDIVNMHLALYTAAIALSDSWYFKKKFAYCVMPILLHSLYSLILSFTPLLLCGKEKRMGTNQNLPLPLVAFFIRPVISSLMSWNHQHDRFKINPKRICIAKYSCSGSLVRIWIYDLYDQVYIT